MPYDPGNNNLGPDATAAASPVVALMDQARRQQQAQAAALGVQQQREALETANTQKISDANQQHVLSGTLANDASQWANTSEYSGVPWDSAPIEAKQHFMAVYGDAPGQLGVSAQAPKAWNDAQTQATGKPVGPQAEAADKYHYFPDPQTGEMMKYDPISNTTTSIAPKPAAGSGVPTAGATGEDALTGMNPDQANLVRQLATYQLPISFLNKYTPAQKTHLAALASQYDPGFDEQQYPIRQKLKESFTSGPDAANITSLNTVIGHIGALSDAADQLHNRGFTPWNAVANAVSGSMGNPAPVSFDQKKAAVSSEMAKLFKGTGSPTDSGVREWENTLKSSESPEQLQAAIQGAVELMGSRAEALRSKYENGFARPKDVQWLNPQSRSVLQKLGVNPDAIDPSSGTQQPTAQAPQQANGFQTAEQVRDAYRAGTLPRDQAETILKQQFGHQ